MQQVEELFNLVGSLRGILGSSCWQDSLSFRLSCPQLHEDRIRSVSAFLSSWDLHAAGICYLLGFLVLMGLSYGHDSLSFRLSYPHARSVGL